MRQTDENTTQSPGLILKLNILQKRDDVLTAIGSYYRSQGHKRSTKTRVKANAKILLLELKPVLSRLKNWDKISSVVNSFDQLRVLVDSNDVEEVITGFEIIDLVLDEKKLTAWDNRKPLDTFDIEAENRANHV